MFALQTCLFDLSLFVGQKSGVCVTQVRKIATAATPRALCCCGFAAEAANMANQLALPCPLLESGGLVVLRGMDLVDSLLP